MKNLRFVCGGSTTLVGCMMLGALLVPEAKAADSAERTTPAAANSAPSTEVPSSGDTAGEELDVEGIKKKYWATGDESAIGVVQNRLFSKSHKFIIGPMAGLAFNDPFESLKPLGFQAGYFFNETWGVSLMGMKYIQGDSDAYRVLYAQGKRVNRVFPRWYVGAEGQASILYGKLSLVGAKIIYYDMNLMAGVGLTRSESGGCRDANCVSNTAAPVNANEMTFHVGLGQRFYITQALALRVDYRMMFNSESVREQTVTQDINTVKGTRTATTHAIQFAFDFLFGFSGKKGN